jgi:hypothetical protein
MPICSAELLPGTRSCSAVIAFVQVLPKSVETYAPSRYVACASTSFPVPVQIGTSSAVLRQLASFVASCTSAYTTLWFCPGPFATASVVRPTTGVGAKPFFVGADAPGSWNVNEPGVPFGDV